MPHVGSEFNQTAIVSWIATAYILTFDAFRNINTYLIKNILMMIVQQKKRRKGKEINYSNTFFLYRASLR